MANPRWREAKYDPRRRTHQTPACRVISASASRNCRENGQFGRVAENPAAGLHPMKNLASLRRKLRAVRAEHAIAAAKTAASGGDIAEAIKQLEVYEKLLAALPRSGFYERYPAILIAGICLLVASVAWT